MLGDLIEERRRDLGLSYQGLHERAERAGFRLSIQSVHQLATKPMTNMPRTETIRALAHALEVPEGTVALACVESVGVKVPSAVSNDSSTTAWLTMTAGRSESQVRHLLRVARTVTEGFDEAAGEGKRRPTESDETDIGPTTTRDRERG